MVRPSYSQHATTGLHIAPPWIHVLTVMLRQVPFRCSTPWPTSQWPPGQNDWTIITTLRTWDQHRGIVDWAPRAYDASGDLRSGPEERPVFVMMKPMASVSFVMNVEWSACYEWSLQKWNGPKISQLHASSCQRNHKQSQELQSKFTFHSGICLWGTVACSSVRE